MEGRIFDIEEFAVYDGPGIRTAVFLQGCPLRCRWCHNPESQLSRPQRMKSVTRCVDCGACARVCPTPERCTGCGTCVAYCPAEALRIAGTTISSSALAARLRAQAAFWGADGGITFTGGEPLAQADFVHAVLDELSGTPAIHTAIETCGYAEEEVFRRLTARLSLVIMDIKLTDPAAHRRWTGVDNAPIRRNLEQLKASGVPFWIRIPLIPGVNDTEKNLRETAKWLEGAKNCERVELLPYHKTAGAKYAQLGRAYEPGFDEMAAVNADTRPFEGASWEVRVL